MDIDGQRIEMANLTSQQTTDKYRSLFADVYGMCDEYVQLHNTNLTKKTFICFSLISTRKQAAPKIKILIFKLDDLGFWSYDDYDVKTLN